MEATAKTKANLFYIVWAMLATLIFALLLASMPTVTTTTTAPAWQSDSSWVKPW